MREAHIFQVVATDKVHTVLHGLFLIIHVSSPNWDHLGPDGCIRQYLFLFIMPENPRDPLGLRFSKKEARRSFTFPLKLIFQLKKII